MKDVDLAPTCKLIEIKAILSSIQHEINNFNKKAGLKCDVKSIEKSDELSIIIYILVQSGIEDLVAQLTVIEDFLPDKIKFGSSWLSQSYLDFKNAVDYLVSLDLQSLEEGGAAYLKQVKIDQVVTNKFRYPETCDSLSQHTNFDIFRVGG